MLSPDTGKAGFGLVCILAASGFIVHLSHAGVLAEDTFESYATGGLENKNGGMGWGEPWGPPLSSALANVVNASSTPLSFTPANGLPVTGGTRAVEIYANPSANVIAAPRRLAGALPSTFYARYLVRLNAGSWGGNNTFSIHFSDTAGNTSSLNFGMRATDPSHFMVRNGTGSPVSGGTAHGEMASGADYFLVARVSKFGSAGAPSTTFDRIELWVNPAASDVTDTPDGDARLQLNTGSGLPNLTHVLVRQAALDSNDRIWFDQLVIGTAWSDVVPSEAVVQPPTVALISPTNGAMFTEPTDVLLEAIATNGDGSVTNVEFFANGSKVGNATSFPYSFAWNGVGAGAYTLTARAADDRGQSAVSDAVQISVLSTNTNGVVSGELKKWHRVTITFDGPETSETATPNPFRDYRLNVAFTHPASGKSYLVPGYFAADGDAANTSADSGDKWRVNFAPDEIGIWSYIASFRAGPDVALSASPAAGSSSEFDGASGTFVIAPTDKTGRDHRGKGRLQYVGKHHLRFAETGEYFLKMGADSPENLLNYDDFDDQPNVSSRRKSWSPHAGDYDPADASVYTWKNGKGTELLGAIKYLAGKGLNAFSFIPFTISGDDKNVCPHRIINVSNPSWSGGVHHDRFDVSRMEQWDRIFAYADKQGMYLHFKTLETENELTMDGGNLGPERTLYYRELIARFGYHLALNWNLGEEINNATTTQKQAWSKYFHDTDAYHHLQVIHNGASHYDLLGTNSHLTGFSKQTGPGNIFSSTLDYLRRSDEAGVPWVVAYDEQNPANVGIVPDISILFSETNIWHDDVRGDVIWSHVLAGGAGVECYFGYSYEEDDLECQDFRSRENWWNQCRYALDFFYGNAVPFWNMTNRDSLVTGLNGTHCFALTGQVYVVYLPNPGLASLNLTGVAGDLTVRWFDPRHGGTMQTGSVSQVAGGGSVSLGHPPTTSTHDWVALVRLVNTQPPRLNWKAVPGGWELAWDEPDCDLEFASEVTGPWHDLLRAPPNPYPIQPTDHQVYYRLRRTDL